MRQVQLTGVPEGITEERLEQGSFSVFECGQRIACNPCQKVCPRNAVSMDSISGTPKVDYRRCNGCGICMSVCPGLAIFCIHRNAYGDRAILKLPYEFLPLPEEGSLVKGCDRSGRVLGDFKVLRVREERKGSRTYIISLELPWKYAMQVRNIIVEEVMQ